MSVTTTALAPWSTSSSAPAEARPQLTFDLDVEVCVVGGGIAGLLVALEAARHGASVAVLESHQVAWNASGHHLGTVRPGFGGDIADLIARVGRDHAGRLWQLTRGGADHIRAMAAEMSDVALTDGVLDVANTDIGDRLAGRLQLLERFGADVEGWPVERVRETLKTPRYFQAVHYPGAFHLHALNFTRELVSLAEQAGVRIFEQTPVISIDAAGLRKRIVTPLARMRASSIVLAGNVHLGSLFQRLSRTLLPVWRYAAVTEPLGDSLASAIDYRGAVVGSAGVDHYRIVDGDRLLWAGPVTTWNGNPRRFASRVERHIRSVFPQLSGVKVADIWSGATGETVHGMPQIGQLRHGFWVASGFGGQGLATSAMAAQLIAGAMFSSDDRWRLFSPFELVWAGGPAGRVAGQLVYSWWRGQAELAGAFARYRERAGKRERQRDARLAAASRAVRPTALRPTASASQDVRPPQPAAAQRADGNLAGS
ncbi:FAD-dependent oxidoreductase [Bradyrhizobium sp. LHD-71]|uniref:NAD(P)/FAD-dependent oxidoreductase n=1 Tax=Bradyrhizobium sp. LHD-71 TaxID=3072141 RepID=UPI00281010FE|nr:FAD-dependent oxidoreductase [Bradyrhizobium sp. LHD-71]MDQ8728533.1 FAD-dependent oxidoreductase [Bradyrhizobium sp. LHD-71]